MFVIKGSVYVHSPKGYIKCVLHRKKVKGIDAYHLVETKVAIPELPEEYDALTFSEIIARYGADAVDDDAEREGS